MSVKTFVFNGDDLTGEQLLGVHRYTAQILKQLDQKLPSDNIKIQVLIPEGKKLSFELANIEVVIHGKEKSSFFGRLCWQQFVFPMYVKKRHAVGIDTILALPVWGIKYISLHDCIVELFSENYQTTKEKMFRSLFRFKTSCIVHNRKIEILTLSEESKKNIVKLYSVDPNRIHIVSCGWEHMKNIVADEKIFEQIGLDPENEPYFFSLGSKYKHKNFEWVLRVAANHPQYKFVVTGIGSFTKFSNGLEQKAPDNVIFTGYISDGEIKALMQKCRAVILPSFYEGFGLPPLEGMSLGSQAIVSSNSCFPEIYGDAVHYINPNDTSVDLDELLNTPVGPAAPVLEKYSWKNAADAMWELLCSD